LALTERETLDAYVGAWSHNNALRGDVAQTITALGKACLGISSVLAFGALAGPLGAHTGKQGETDSQRQLDVVANDQIITSLAGAPVALLISEELDDPLPIQDGAPLIVAVDPVDGASNADTNAAIGTIFSILPNVTDPAHLCLGSRQLAAGFVVYGPQTVMALTVGEGTAIFTLNRRSGQFELSARDVRIPVHANEFAINASNHWHWEEPIRTYVDDCLRGAEGPRGATFNMRWTGSFVAEIYRILIRGGVYLYPGDRRKGFKNGRLRLVYEANPVAWIVEQAGGAASTGRAPVDNDRHSMRVLDCAVRQWHQRSPVVIGSREEVGYIERLHADPHAVTERSPLFGRRGLFRV
jgi:fructose-1,6-bisphosphatase I